MSDGYNFKALKAGILKLSVASDWETARKEWKLIQVHEVEEPQACLCEHYPIIEVCTIKNVLSGHQTEVGNRCVKRFLGFRSDLIFAALKRVRKDNDKSLNADAIAFFYEQGYLNDWEYQFYQSTMRKRILSDKQQSVRNRVNAKVLNLVRRKGL